MPTRRLSGIAVSASSPDNGGDHSGGGGGSGGGPEADDVFSTYVYAGTGSLQKVENGIDLANEGGLVWIKNRTSGALADRHVLTDTEMPKGGSGMYPFLSSDMIDALNPADQGNISVFNENGFSLSGNYDWHNKAGQDYVSWTFRKAPNFFDVVTYTGDGVAGREIPHNLGASVGMAIVKSTSHATPWLVNHVDIPDNYLTLETDDGALSDVKMTSTDSIITWTGSDVYYNKAGHEYVAYLFANDDSPDSLIEYGSYTGNQTAGNEVDLGFEPQFVLIKASSSKGEWYMFDTMRGIVTGGFDPFLRANMSAVESASSEQLEVNPTGFSLSADPNVNKSGIEYIYMAIRRPNKPAEEFDPEELFAVNTRGTVPNEGAGYRSGFVTDFAFRSSLSGGSIWPAASSRLTGDAFITMSGSAAESPSNVYRWDFMDGYYVPSSANTDTPSWMWRRAPGHFDVVAYEGDGQAGREVPHNLGVAPEMMWVKARTGGNSSWRIGGSKVGNGTNNALILNTDQAMASNNTYWDNKGQTSDVLYFGASAATNGAGIDFIAYLFASVPGISKVGSYTGNGSEVTVDCGFTNGASWVLVKRTDAAGDWWMTSAPSAIHVDMIALNKTDASFGGSGFGASYTYPQGFKVINSNGGLNTDGAEYIFYAIA